MNFCPERLTALRNEKGLTRAEAARLLNMSAMGYGRYEKGERTPSYQTVSYMAQFFNTSTDYLYGLSDDRAASSITINAADNPALFSLVQTAMADKDAAARLLAYAATLTKGS